MAKIFNTDYLNTVLYEKNFHIDRAIDSILELPYTWFDVKIKPNEIVTTQSINAAITKLNDNFLYLISKSRIPSDKIPHRSGYTTFFGSEFNVCKWYDNDELPSVKVNTSQGALARITDGQIVDGRHTSISGICGVLVDNHTNVIVLTSQSLTGQALTGAEILSNNNLVDNYTDRTFNRITDIDITNSNILYILDSGDKIVYRYDFAGTTYQDPAYFSSTNSISGRLLTTVLGGTGTSNATFTDPISLTTDGIDDLYIVDGVSVKQYDNNSNWKETFNISDEVGTDRVVDMKYSASTSSFYVLLSSGKLIEYDKAFSQINECTFNETQTSDFINPQEPHYYKKIQFSTDDDNMFYVLTNQTAYKRFKTSPAGYIGKFKFANRNLHLEESSELSFMSILSADGGDRIFLGDNETGCIYNFNEATKYESAIYSSYESQIVPLSGILIDRDEYINNITYNKCLGKLIFNHKHLVNSIKSKFTASFDVYGNREYAGVRILLPEEIDAWFVVNHPYFPDINNYIGINELLLAPTINRTLKRIYDMQLSIIDTYQVEMLNFKPAEALDENCPPSPTPTSYTTPTPTPSVTPTLTPTIPPTPTPTITPTPTLPPWPYAQSYTFTAAAINGMSITVGGSTYQQTGYDHLNGTYTTSATGWGSYRYNEAPLYYNGEAVLWFNGRQWTFDDGVETGGTRQVHDDVNIQSTLLQRLTSIDTPAVVPIGEYYRTDISEEVIGSVL
jgi:hypothetical protein